MHILLTNDDGIFAPGLAAIYKQLIKIGKVSVVAPEASKSGTGHGITFHSPLECNKIDNNGLFKGYSIHGTPADCVKLAVIKLFDEPIDLVVSGINNGSNVGINVFYSGTVAAAIEAAFLNIPSVALSLALEENMDFETAGKYCLSVIQKLMPLKSGEVVNINIPPLSKGNPKGIRIAHQSTSGLEEFYLLKENEQSRCTYQLAGGQYRIDDTPADTTSILEGYITITALLPDMTHHSNNLELEKRLAKANPQLLIEKEHEK